jgi:hypothetical protein
MNYYTFEVDGQKAGYYEEDNADGILYSCAKFVVGGHSLENPFWIEHSDSRIDTYKFGEEDYKPFNESPNVYPSSAIALLIPKVKKGQALNFLSFNEGEGKIEGEATLELEGNKIVETVNGKVNRHFIIDDKSNVVTYFWGGTAYSHKVACLEEAVKGTAWEHTT